LTRILGVRISQLRSWFFRFTVTIECTEYLKKLLVRYFFGRKQVYKFTEKKTFCDELKKNTNLQVRRWLWDFVSRSSFLKANFSILPPSFDTIALKESIWMSLLWSQYSSNKSIYSRNWSFDGSPVQTLNNPWF